MTDHNDRFLIQALRILQEELRERLTAIDGEFRGKPLPEAIAIEFQFLATEHEAVGTLLSAAYQRLGVYEAEL